MKTNNKTFVVLALCFLLFGNISCLKKQNLDDNKLGSAVDPAEVQNKMGTSIGGFDFESILKNELSEISAYTTIEDSQKIHIFDQKVLVTELDRQSEPGTLHIKLKFTKSDAQDPSQSVVDQPYDIAVSDSKQVAQLNTLTQKAVGPYFLFRAYAYMAIYACREQGVTCYNFTDREGKILLGPSLADPRICKDSTQCQITTHQIEFDSLDTVNTTADGKPIRSHYTFIVSPQLPFFSKVLKYCVRGLIDSGNRKVLAEDCVSVNNFAVGN